MNKRIATVNKGMVEYELMTKGEKFESGDLEAFYGAMCDDIKAERARIGGDWVVACVVDKRSIRDFIRSRLGPDLVFVLLDMPCEQQMERIRGRHDNDEMAVEMMKEAYKLAERKSEDEENAIELKITKDMTPDIVVQKILEMTK